jgi:hypothetical protein
VSPWRLAVAVGPMHARAAVRALLSGPMRDSDPATTRTTGNATSPPRLPADDRASQGPSSSDSSEKCSWSPSERIAFRLGAIYFAVYSLLNGNVATLPLVSIARDRRPPDWYSNATNAVVAAVGHAIGIRGEIRAFDNGDSVGDHVQLLCLALVALVGTGVWSVLDRHRREYRRELELVYRGVRYVLAMTVFAYAIFKIFPAQFSFPSPTRLVQTYGASSRMGLLWTFMGASPAYQMFAGWAELLGCVLVVVRRTATLGALVLFAILTNVLMMDICYDVPAKLCVLHLLGMTIALLVPNARRLIDVFVRNRAVPPTDLGPPPSRGRTAGKLVFVALVLYAEAVPTARYYFTERDGAPVPPLYGAYEVKELRRAGALVPRSFDDAGYWRFFAIDRRRATAVMVDGSRAQFQSSANRRDSFENGTSSLVVAPLGADEIVVEGTYRGDPISLLARRTDELLVRERVRWFNDGSDVR